MKNSHEQDNTAFFGHPKPLKDLFFTEFWERFSYYGIRPLLILYMSALSINGGLGLDRPTAAAIVGLFAGSIYLITIFGGWIADNWLGQARSVWYGSILMALGHLSIALNAWFDQFFFYFGLVLIVLGSGLFKTCITVIVGTLYNAQDTRRDAGFSIFYMGINLGAFIAPLFTGLFIENNGWHIGFGIGGIGMLIALIFFRFTCTPQLVKFNENQATESAWNKPVTPKKSAPKIVFAFILFCTIIISLVTLNIITINPIILSKYLTASICIVLLIYFIYLIFLANSTPNEKKQIMMCFLLIIIAVFFWSSLEQQPTSFNLFAQDFTQRYVGGYEIPTVWFQSLNPIFMVLFAPVLAWLWTKLGKSNLNPSYITKFIISIALAGCSFIIMYFASQRIILNGGALVSPLWLVFSLLFLTLGELCLSPIGLSAMTKLAPTQLRGQIMGLWMTSIALGSLIAGLIGGHVSAESLQELPMLFIQCAIILFAGAIILFIFKKPILKFLTTSNN
ncbi:peptide MFS transporter [Acinetobacter equi]|uniref:Major facilitator superfamily (MFS) profile domain-containing protein n=1 Tax=Acinetobacter equi TaxID=1324350 RepID=A0A0N9VVU9_9GAMM|nr:peptide MFS transporter [Acinetobacter equi]ALH94157.1 hypothetical protein AOY20_00600 [Acinetobacter equi]